MIYNNRLGNIATYINGYAFKPTDWCDIGKPIIRIQDLTDNSYQMNRFNGVIDSKYNVKKGDVLISWSASLGVYEWQGEDAVLNQHIFKVVFDKVEIDKRFFVYQTEKVLTEAQEQAHGATMKHLTKPVFDALPFYLPSLDTQKDIAKRLEIVRNLISKSKEQINLLDDLVKSQFIEMFGEVENNQYAVGFETAFTIRDDLRKPINDAVRSEMHTGELYPYYGANGQVDSINQYLMDSDAICLAEDCGAYGAGEPTSYLVSGKCWVNNHAHVLIPKAGCDIRFANILFRIMDLSEYVSGTTRQKLTQGKMKQIPIMLPPIELQKQFAAFVQQSDKSKVLFMEQKKLYYMLGKVEKNKRICYNIPVCSS